MTPLQIDLVQRSFQRVAPIATDAASLFYGRLFELDPTLRPMFRGDLREQGKMLMAMLATGVRSLQDPRRIEDALRGLGARHAAYGVRDEHYGTVGSALLWTLEQGLGEGFTPEVRDAWAAAYGFLARAMQAGAAAVSPPAGPGMRQQAGLHSA